VLAIVAGVVGLSVGALWVGAISLAGASRSWAGKIGVVGVGAEVIAVDGVVSVNSQGSSTGLRAVAVVVSTALDEVSTT
jgi:hypothetical protein